MRAVVTAWCVAVAVLGLAAQVRTGTLTIYYIDTEGGQSTLFVGPTGDSLLVEVVYYGFEMNARGVLYDYLNYNGRTLFKRFDATGVKIATSLRGSLNVRTDTDNGWSLEAMIPWPNFAELSRRPPIAGTVWKVNFNRWDGVEPSRRMSIWSDPQNNESWPHVPSRFGEIVFVE